MIRFEEIPRVGRVRRAAVKIKGERRVAANQNRHGAAAAGGPRGAPRVRGNVGGHDNRVPSVPRARVGPQKGVQKGGGAAVTGVDDRGAFQVGVAGEQVQKDRFGRFALIDEGFGAHFQTSHIVRVNVVSKIELKKRVVEGERGFG